MFKKSSLVMIINLLFLAIICTLTTAMEEENSYTIIAGIIKDIDHEKEIITIVREAKNGNNKEFNIKAAKGVNYIFVRDDKGLLSVDSIKVLMSGDEVSVKCKGSKGEYEAVEIEKIDKVNDDQSIEVDAPIHR